jgi:hypothetical protein
VLFVGECGTDGGEVQERLPGDLCCFEEENLRMTATVTWRFGGAGYGEAIGGGGDGGGEVWVLANGTTGDGRTAQSCFLARRYTTIAQRHVCRVAWTKPFIYLMAREEARPGEWI